jgi:hypothetical protein
MRLFKILFIALMALLTVSSAAIANDFDWTNDLNIRAQADPIEFRAMLATRFKIGGVQVDAVLSNAHDPADAYIMLRLGEMSGKPIDYIVEKYRNNADKGWGALAKSLGIKPGSQEFHALKQDHDLKESNRRGKLLYSSYDNDNYIGNDRGKGKNKK